MKSLLGILGSIGVATGGVTVLSAPLMMTTSFDNQYSAILVDVVQDVSIDSSNSAGGHSKSTENVRFADLQIEFHMDYDVFLKADFNIHAIGSFKIHTHLNPQDWSEAELKKESSTTDETRYIAKLHHEAQNGWAKQKGDIKITLTIKNDNSMWVKTDVSAESYGSVSSISTISNLKGMSFK